MRMYEHLYGARSYFNLGLCNNTRPTYIITLFSFILLWDQKNKNERHVCVKIYVLKRLFKNFLTDHSVIVILRKS